MKTYIFFAVIACLLVSSGCANYGRGTASFNLKLHKDSPFGDQQMGKISVEKLTWITVAQLVFTNQDVERHQFPEFDVKIKRIGVSVEMCRFGWLDETKSFHQLEEEKASKSWWNSNLYTVTFKPTVQAEAFNEYDLVVKCQMIENRAIARAEVIIDPQMRNHFQRWLQIIPWFRPSINSGEHFLK